MSLATVALARTVWAKLGYDDFDAAWRTLGGQLLLIVAAGQLSAARQAAVYVPAVLGELNIDATAVAELAPRSLVGVASDGRPLGSLLYRPIVQARTALGQGSSLADSLRAGGNLLDRIVSTQVVDAGRAAESVSTAVRPQVSGWVRMLTPPSCPRCTVLAGRFYRYNAGFLRHPGDDCIMIPANEDVAGDLRTDPLAAIKSGQVAGLSAADTRAIVEDGADPAKVINSHRGMSTEQSPAGKIQVTTEGTSKSRRGTVRLRPESIYQLATDRGDAIRLLTKFGYIV